MFDFSALAGLRMLAVVCCAIALGGCSVSVATYNEKPLLVWVDSDVKDKAVNRAMMLTLVSIGWTVIERTPKRITATLNYRGVDATVELRRENEYITIFVKSSECCPHHGRTRQTIPKRWLSNLHKNLITHIAPVLAADL